MLVTCGTLIYHTWWLFLAAWITRDPKNTDPVIYERAKPVAERAGVLTVSCESSVWAQELDLMSDAIRERLNERLTRGRTEA